MPGPLTCQLLSGWLNRKIEIGASIYFFNLKILSAKGGWE